MAADLLAAHDAGTVRVAIGRASDYFGPRGLVSHMGERVFYRALAGKNAQVLGDPDQPHTFSYIPDIGAGLATLGVSDQADGRAWHLPNAETVSTRTFIDCVYGAAGTRGKVKAMPRLMVNLVALFNRDVREIKEVLFEFEDSLVTCWRSSMVTPSSRGRIIIRYSKSFPISITACPAPCSCRGNCAGCSRTTFVSSEAPAMPGSRLFRR